MRFIILFLFLLTQLNSQSLSPIPVPGGTKFYFVSEYKFAVLSVSVAGSFNNWNKDEFLMEKDTNHVWSVVVPLEPGKEYHYKFVINGTQWITDPNAPNRTYDEWANGIIIPQKYGSPFVRNFTPANLYVADELPEITALIEKYSAPIDKNSINFYLNNNLLQHEFNEETSTLKAKLPENLEDGEHYFLLKFCDVEGNEGTDFKSIFYLNRIQNKINSPKFYDSSIMYEIYIRKFNDSDNDGIGDFNGITEKLDYLEKLGVNSIWLMPFNESSTEHGYNVIDYFSINNDYGTFNDYLNFLKEAKKKGMKVIMDFVINHTDSLHPFFLDAYKNPASKYSSWYQFVNEENSDWKHFGVERKMPKLNFENEDVQNYFIEVAKFWLDPNGDGDFIDAIDGFRCDAAKEVPLRFWQKLRNEIKNINSDVLLLGEVWDYGYYLNPYFKDAFDMLFDYPLFYNIEQFYEDNQVLEFQRKFLYNNNLFSTGHQLITFHSNHDNKRGVTRYGSEEKFLQAFFLQMIIPGTPMIYYGDEIALGGELPPENVRQLIDWQEVENQINDNNSFFNKKLKIINLRKNINVLSKRHDREESSLKFISSINFDILTPIRFDEEKTLFALINNTGKRVENITYYIHGFNEWESKKAKVIFSSNEKDFGKLFSFKSEGHYLFLHELKLESGSYILFELID